jgi:multisubunit Na+/H+ antiporter MnhG subunit
MCLLCASFRLPSVLTGGGLGVLCLSVCFVGLVAVLLKCALSLSSSFVALLLFLVNPASSCFISMQPVYRAPDAVSCKL